MSGRSVRYGKPIGRGAAEGGTQAGALHRFRDGERRRGSGTGEKQPRGAR
ncbi:hypothetical protein ABZ707_07260 [Streptomyces sp. NPDC006923]